jgi:hypothetical protein
VIRPLAVLLLGLWLGMLIASWVVATINFRTVDRVLGPGSRPEVAAKLQGVPAGDRRVVLRHLASEINRWVFRWWGLAQLALAGALLAAAWRTAGTPRLLAAAALALTLVQIVALGPPVLELGRSLDFVPRPLPPDLARRFGLLHAGYVGTDLVKALVLAAEAWALIRRSGF